MVKLNQAICEELVATAAKICQPGKGILAADESTGTIGKRFTPNGIENTEENRAYYRGNVLFKTPNLGDYCSGSILYEETLYQKAPCGTKMVDLLAQQNIVPGIKVDLGLVEMWGTDGEKATQGLDGLQKRCEEYYEAGARFSKFRCVLNIGDGKPSETAVAEVAHTLARYASICQQAKIVPIVEPEILTDGNHDIKKCAEVAENVLANVFKHLALHHVLLEGCLLKPSMVAPGSDGPAATNEEIATYTLRTLSRTAPPALAGIFFLSGGQSEEDASVSLNAMNVLKTSRHPWTLSFSYGRALQATCIKTWAGKEENLKAGQDALTVRCKANHEAALGKYAGGAGGADAQKTLFVANYTY